MNTYTGKMPVILFLCLMSGILFGSDDGILTKVQEAIDPTGKLARVETKTTEGTLEMPLQKVKAEVKSYFKKPDKYRIDTTFEDGTKEIWSFDGSKVWKWSSTSNKVEEIEGLDRGSFILNARLETPDMREWPEKAFASMSVDDKTLKIDEYDCIRLVCKLKDEFGFKEPMVFYVDKAKYLIRRMDMPASMGGKELEQTVKIKNYRIEDGVLFPSMIKSSIFGAEIDYQIKDIRFNESIEDSLFTDIDK